MSVSLTSIEPARAALLLMDYQPGVLQRLGDSDALVNRARAAIASARTRGMTI